MTRMRHNPSSHVALHTPAKIALTLLVLFAAAAQAAAPWQSLPDARWSGETQSDVEGLPGRHAAVIAQAAGRKPAPLRVTTAEAAPAGVYEIRLTLRPSHVADAIAFHSGLRVSSGETLLNEFPGSLFARVHQAETRIVTLAHHTSGPLAFTVEGFADAGVAERARTATHLKQGGPEIGEALDDLAGGAGFALDMVAALSPARAVYYLVDEIAYRPLSRSGRVVKVTRNKIRYAPGATLTGEVWVDDVGGTRGTGTLNLYLERGVRDRVKVKSLPVTLTPAPQAIPFELPLPTVELGYAVVAEFVSADGADRHEAAEYFTIAASFNRVYIAGGGSGGHGGTKADEARMRQGFEAMRDNYGNASEHFAWAEEDMVEMSPETDYWFSGQTCYHLKKTGLQQMIRLAHEYGIAQVSYAKFIMSGYLGWKTAYDYPNDHRGQYHYPVGMWEGVNNKVLDRFRNKEFLIYENTPGRIGSNPFYVWWADFLPINPDATPRMARIAAEEVVRSAKLFGWDGIRWDGHPRGGGQCGGAGPYDAGAARRTQALVRYFKEIVGAEFPAFGHGYNYLLIQKEPGYDWAYEDFELDELCRGGGLIMNESIGNATSGPYGYIARNLQVEGNLVRERGGYYLGISFASGPRDELVESALWAAAGARPYNSGHTLAMRRYMTRFAQYTLDENLRRLATPEQVLKPLAETRLWWQPFVYETPLADGKRQLVVNLLNLPLDAQRNPEGKASDFRMLPGTDPVAFTLSLPEGMTAVGAHLIDPQTLAVEPLPLRDGRFELPAIAHWLVAVIDLHAAPGAPSLAALYGPPRTFGVPRPKRSEAPPPELVLDTGKAVWAVNKEMSALAPAGARRTADEQAARDALPFAERQTKLLEIRAKNPAESLIAGWWKGGTLPADLKLKEKPPAFGDLAPRRDGCFDIFHGRGALDYRLRLADAFARLGRFSVHDAPLAGLFRAGGGQHLTDGVAASRFPAFDLLLYTAIPHCAIGVQNSYALVDYVTAGGAVLFTGGEYAFGKGGYMHTVLERGLLPVLCTETVDTRCSEEPLAFEAGKDFAELKASVDFTAKPSFWVWNQVALKDDPSVKVFLKSGNRPILVGWQLGKGRVACLLADHRGKSEQDVTAFFDWKEWPELLHALFTWLAPEASRVDPPPPAAISAAEAKRLLAELDAESLTQDLAAAIGAAEVADGMPTGDSVGDTLSDESLQRRLDVINRVLAAPGQETAAILADQLATVGALPITVRFAILDAVRRDPPVTLSDTIRRCLGARNSAIRGNGYLLAALCNDPAFAQGVTGTPTAFETDLGERTLALALGLATYTKDDLVETGRRRVQAWNDDEQKAKNRYTGGAPFSLAAPEGPLLDKETLFARVAWLAYLTRHGAAATGAPFAREWLMTAQYEDYCDQSIGNLWNDKELSDSVKRGRAKDFQRLRASLARLRDLTRPDLEALAARFPEQAAAGFRQAHFTAEYRAALNFLGSQDRAASAAFAALLQEARNPDLAAFARALALR